jgi:PII-like signaling protein
MPADKALRVTIYVNEADEWQGKPLHLEILRYLQRDGHAGGTVLRGVAGFTQGAGVVTTSLVDAGGKLPLVIQFVDAGAAVARALPQLRKMAGDRLITTEEVRIEP